MAVWGRGLANGKLITKFCSLANPPAFCESSAVYIEKDIFRLLCLCLWSCLSSEKSVWLSPAFSLHLGPCLLSAFCDIRKFQGLNHKQPSKWYVILLPHKIQSFTAACLDVYCHISTVSTMCNWTVQVWKWGESYASTVTGSQPNWTPMEDFGALCSTIETPNEELYFGRMLFVLWPQIRVSLIRQRMSRFATSTPITETRPCLLFLSTEPSFLIFPQSVLPD